MPVFLLSNCFYRNLQTNLHHFFLKDITKKIENNSLAKKIIFHKHQMWNRFEISISRSHCLQTFENRLKCIQNVFTFFIFIESCYNNFWLFNDTVLSILELSLKDIFRLSCWCFSRVQAEVKMIPTAHRQRQFFARRAWNERLIVPKTNQSKKLYPISFYR